MNKTNIIIKPQTKQIAKSQTSSPQSPTPCKDPHNKKGQAKVLRAKAPSPTPSQKADLIKIGLDVGLRKYASCRQIDGSLQEAPRLFTPQTFKEWLLSQKALSRRVAVCYEAGLFGFELARWIQSQGMECLVMAPVKLDEGNKRVETDKLNARDICGRLDRYLAGNTRALTLCRIPTREEELARHQTRQRQQLLDERKGLEAQGRCLLWQFGYITENSRWWTQEVWEGLSQRVEQKLMRGLGRLRAVILELNQQLEELVGQLAEQAKTALPQPLQQRIRGLGWMSLLILTRELMQWKRFNNRRQIGGFTGLVPSEATTGQQVRLGSITKVGNPVVRTILVEMAWRLVRYQPECRAIKPWLTILQNKKAGAGVRKKAIIAVARVLAVDLWRLATGQTTCQKLGFVIH